MPDLKENHPEIEDWTDKKYAAYNDPDTKDQPEMTGHGHVTLTPEQAEAKRAKRAARADAKAAVKHPAHPASDEKPKE